MPQVVECVPNFSEGRRPEVISALTEAIVNAGGRVLDVHSDPDHNRCVITFVGDPGRVEEAAVAVVALAARLIDMDSHIGVHPRIGAADVVPFVPLREVSLDDCVTIARRVAQRIGEELELPVYLYAAAAERPERVSLPAIRKGGYEGLKETIATDPDRAPDAGPKRIGPAGAVAVGARPPLVAFNAYLATDDMEAARAVARAIRASSGGLTHVQAKALHLPSADAIQVSMNLLAPDETPLHRTLELLRVEAARRGVAVARTELVGLVPRSAVAETAGWYLQLPDFTPERIIETHLGPEPGQADVSVPEVFMDEVAADTPTPGGGSVAAYVGGLGAALGAMVAGLTIGRPRYAAVEDEMQKIRARCFELQRRMLELMEEDMAAFSGVMGAYRLPKATPEEAAARQEAIQAGLRRATEVPLETMRSGVEVLRLAARAAELGNTNAISDAGIAGRMAHAACHGASFNVAINVRSLRDLAEGDTYRRQSMELLKDADRLVDEVDRTVRSRIAG